MTREKICLRCYEVAPLSVIWGQYITEKGRLKFWRDEMCEKCAKSIGARGGRVR